MLSLFFFFFSSSSMMRRWHGKINAAVAPEHPLHLSYYICFTFCYVFSHLCYFISSQVWIAHPNSAVPILHYINEVSSPLFCCHGNVSLLHGFIAIHIYFASVNHITADFINSPSFVLIRFNSRVVHYIERRKKNSANLGNGTASNTDIDDGCDATVVLLKKGNAVLFYMNHAYNCLVCHLNFCIVVLSLLANFHRKPSVLMVDELLSAYPHQLSFSEAGMRIMITSHFSPRTRLTMASRMLITEVSHTHLHSHTSALFHIYSCVKHRTRYMLKLCLVFYRRLNWVWSQMIFCEQLNVCKWTLSLSHWSVLRRIDTLPFKVLGQ